MTIDWWTLGFQSVNVLVLMWLLHRFFWKPVSATIAERRASVQAKLDAATAKEQHAALALEGIAKTREGLQAERESVIVEAQASAEAVGEEIRAQARQEADALRARALEQWEKEQAARQSALESQAVELAVVMAARLMGRLEGAVVREVFLEWLVEAIAALPEKDRQSAAAPGAPLEAISAAALAPDEQSRVSEAVRAALGTERKIVFTTDPSLIAGLELRGPHFSLRNSWRADLDKLRQEMLSHA
jgi:F-type H+-transporting ATPase subunit b